eukprot:15447225-Alexandrium_andersonii.AAC.1
MQQRIHCRSTEAGSSRQAPQGNVGFMATARPSSPDDPKRRICACPRDCRLSREPDRGGGPPDGASGVAGRFGSMRLWEAWWEIALALPVRKQGVCFGGTCYAIGSTSTCPAFRSQLQASEGEA